MADVRISALPAASSATTGNEFAANQVGTTRKITLEQLHDAYVLGRGGAATNINNSTTTTSIYSVSIPANVMGTNRTVRTRLQGEYWHSVGATATMNIRIGLSTTTMWYDTSAALVVSTTSRPVNMDFDLTNLGATNSQLLWGKILIGEVVAITGWGELDTDEIMATTPFHGTAAVNTTSAVTLDVFVRHSVASTLVTYRHWTGYTELI